MTGYCPTCRCAISTLDEWEAHQHLPVIAATVLCTIATLHPSRRAEVRWKLNGHHHVLIPVAGDTPDHLHTGDQVVVHLDVEGRLHWPTETDVPS